MQIGPSVIIEYGLGGIWASVIVNALAAFSNHTKHKVLLREYRLHAHVEKQGPLTVDGIQYPRTNGSK